MLFPRTIRLDGSDLQVFEKAAEPGEPAVSGAFMFERPEELTGRPRQAFTHGFLGLGSFGWSTLAVVASMDARAFEEAVEALGQTLYERFGAPSLAAAVTAARSEVTFAAELCEYPVNTLLSVSRSIRDDGIVEKFSAIEHPDKGPARTWELVDDSGE